MPNPIAVPLKNGDFFIPALGRSFKPLEIREDDYYDTVRQASGSVTAGTELKWFDSLADKNDQHKNINQAARIPANHEAAIFRVGVHPRGAHGNTQVVFNDIQKMIENGYLLLKFNRRTITEGPLVKYQSGYGLGGYSDATGATAVSIGVPSAAAAPVLFSPQQLVSGNDLTASLFYKSAAWISGYAVPSLAGDITLTLFLHGIIKAPTND